MRRFFIFAVLWAALFGPGHVLAACPMAQAGHDGTPAPCHSEQDHGNAASQGHDCCVWVAPSGGWSKAFVQKGAVEADHVADDGFTLHAVAPWVAQSLTHPPPLFASSHSQHAALSGSGTFLRTGRLRL